MVDPRQIAENLANELRVLELDSLADAVLANGHDLNAIRQTLTSSPTTTSEDQVVVNRCVDLIDDVLAGKGTPLHRSITRHERLTMARSPQVAAELYRWGFKPHEPPSEDLQRLSTHLEPTWISADGARRMTGLAEMQLGWDESHSSPRLWTELATDAMTITSPYYSQAEVLSVSPAQIKALPPLTAAETHRTFMEEPLPWPVTYIDVKARTHKCPELYSEISDTEYHSFRFTGAMCLQAPDDDGVFVAPFVAFDEEEPDIIDCPIVLWFRDGGVPEIDWPYGLAAAMPITNKPDATSVDLFWPYKSTRSTEMATIALGGASFVAGLLQILSAINVSVSPRKLEGKSLRKWRRQGHQLPHVITVESKKRIGDESTGSGGRLSTRHTVRGHWMHVTKGPVFNANPDARRWVPSLNCEAVRIWRNPHVRGPEDTPIVPSIRHMREPES